MAARLPHVLLMRLVCPPLQGDKGAPGRAGLYGEIGPTGDFGECTGTTRAGAWARRGQRLQVPW